MAVLSTLTEAAGHLTVSDIHERIRAGGKQVDLSTVYRTVSMLQELDLVHAVALPDQAVTYGVVEAAHHHAVCTSCQLITEVPAAVLSIVLANAVQLAQRATGYTLEHGHCSYTACARDAMSRPPPHRSASHSGIANVLQLALVCASTAIWPGAPDASDDHRSPR